MSLAHLAEWHLRLCKQQQCHPAAAFHDCRFPRHQSRTGEGVGRPISAWGKMDRQHRKRIAHFFEVECKVLALAGDELQHADGFADHFRACDKQVPE